MSVQVFAQEELDLTRKGTISITMRCGQNAVAGGTLTVYRVGAVSGTAGSYAFELTGKFENCGISITDIQSSELAGKLADYVAENGVVGLTKELDEQGMLTFTNLKPGLYLLIQNRAASGFEKVSPFLVTVPITENGTYIYDVDASPKTEVKQVEEETETPSAKPSQSTTGTGGSGSLPQTGQLNWPIPLLAVSGLFFFLLGWILALARGKSAEKVEQKQAVIKNAWIWRENCYAKEIRDCFDDCRGRACFWGAGPFLYEPEGGTGSGSFGGGSDAAASGCHRGTGGGQGL